ncbi:MAG: hypothetical protein A2X86_11175 [Bdellovibrionales bacterium GWA2_49_15]|nr:MAG: hypothetical protein A2X86_11175 [Bdellovibrionales bacterium GWA2_49_15]HAZ12688.1 hypothetical protein [Bdellovibrionales bacterium]
MYDTLTAINLAPGNTSVDLPSDLKAQLFEMSTCQRHLLVGLGVWPDKALSFLNDNGIHGLSVYHGSEAYTYLLEVITGLKSRLLGESEVAGQFKKAYDSYKSSATFNSVCGQILEKLMKDGKEIKTKHLQSIGQYSYAGLAKRVLQNHSVSGQILIVGTGQLAQDTAKLLRKLYDLSFTGRNPEKLDAICKECSGTAVAWPLDFTNASGLENFTAIINTVGADEILFGPSFFEQWNKQDDCKTFIDLGRPSVIQTCKGISEGVYRLADLLTLGQRFDEAKLIQVQKAHTAIEQLTQKRIFGACAAFPFGWEELQFA